MNPKTPQETKRKLELQYCDRCGIKLFKEDIEVLRDIDYKEIMGLLNLERICFGCYYDFVDLIRIFKGEKREVSK
jgi:hypothetical protein